MKSTRSAISVIMFLLISDIYYFLMNDNKEGIRSCKYKLLFKTSVYVHVNFRHFRLSSRETWKMAASRIIVYKSKT